MQDPSFTASSVDLAVHLWLGIDIPQDTEINPMGWFLIGAGVPSSVAIKLSEALYVDTTRDESNQ